MRGARATVNAVMSLSTRVNTQKKIEGRGKKDVMCGGGEAAFASKRIQFIVPTSNKGRQRMVLGRPSSAPGGPTGIYYLIARILSAATRLETSTSISLTLSRLRQWKASRGDKIKYTFMVVVASICFYVMTSPPFPYKLAIPGLFTLLILVPITSQFFLPAAPILLYLLIFFSSQFVPAPSRPHIWVSVLPTLETILYGGSISDILTRFGHPMLDILAWIPYGVGHFVMPFVVAAFIFVFAPPGATKFFGAAFGFMNVFAVIMQFVFPCAPPWYELREGLTPANYGMKGSPAGLARIDALFHSHGYTSGFTNAPVPFGAFPSLHAADATIEALFCSYFFPLMLEIPIPFSGSGKGARKRLRLDARILYWAYAFWLYWCTMYLMHHYLVDLVGGSCLATISFYCECLDGLFLHTPASRSAHAHFYLTSRLPYGRDAGSHGAKLCLPTIRGGAHVCCSSGKLPQRGVRHSLQHGSCETQQWRRGRSATSLFDRWISWGCEDEGDGRQGKRRKREWQEQRQQGPLSGRRGSRGRGRQRKRLGQQR